MSATEPWIALEGSVNFRDLGGCMTVDGRRVRTGRVYRSDTLHRLTNADLERLRALRLRSAIDLRAGDEIELIGKPRLDELGVVCHHLPARPRVIGGRPSETTVPAAEHYFSYLSSRDTFAGILRVVADPDAQPTVFFCAAGKDRTGVVAAFVLGLLGVGDETVAADYARTSEVLEDIFARTRAEYPRDTATWRNLSPDLMTARAETMLEFLALVRERFGGWDGFVGTLDIDPSLVDSLRASLLE